jgi:membrane protein
LIQSVHGLLIWKLRNLLVSDGWLETCSAVEVRPSAQVIRGLRILIVVTTERSWIIVGGIGERNENLQRRLRLSWGNFFKCLYHRYEDHAVADGAATLGYYFVFSVFPFRPFLPSQVRGLIEPQMRGLVANSRPQLLTLGLAAALYSASRGVNAVRIALNRAYDVKESRPLWKTELLAFGMTVGGGLLLLLGIGLLVSGGSAGQWVARHLSIADEYMTVLKWIRWPITTVAIMLAAALSYYLLPDVEQKFKFITPGSVFGTLVWFLASWSFGIYVSHFGSYNVTYGSIGGVIVLLTWFYITGFILLMGGEMNAIIEDASSDGKMSGARAANQAPPPPDERPSAMPPGVTDSASVAERSYGKSSGSRKAPAESENQ